MVEKREYVKRLGVFLHQNGTTMSITELADHLKRNHFKTDSGADYEGGRGTYGFISTTYDWLVAQGQQAEADSVAKAFTKPDGSYAY
ncbi:hypothetical protein [Spirosoma pollinicola]|uniref:Uncharacterized protein n=1 Tax=Spirosoma pollinicola TaxID=2057025 RepID=A0A2K8Z9E4_9BACT|nr:hypothetical protein [Spirosoma pollinicola]AUD06503.1 hypothetical protein CWM47_34450 [Spirosoma pollinicola]